MENNAVNYYLEQFHVLTTEEINALLGAMLPRTLKKGEYFIHAGEICQEVAFVNSGTLRSFFISPEGEEHTYCITFPQTFMTAYSSFITAQPTAENIQAITHTELLVLPKKDIDRLTPTSPGFMHLQKVIAEYQYLELEQRIFQLQQEKAHQRYLNLLKEHPEYIQQIPLQYLASYLGITQRHLSRIRRELAVF